MSFVIAAIFTFLCRFYARISTVHHYYRAFYEDHSRHAGAKNLMKGSSLHPHGPPFLSAAMYLLDRVNLHFCCPNKLQSKVFDLSARFCRTSSCVLIGCLDTWQAEKAAHKLANWKSKLQYHEEKSLKVRSFL
jgi:hypothetical protein